MQPTNELTEQLFSSCPERVKLRFYDHVVPEDAVLPFVVAKGPSGRNLCFNFTQRSSTVMVIKKNLYFFRGFLLIICYVYSFS